MMSRLIIEKKRVGRNFDRLIGLFKFSQVSWVLLSKKQKRKKERKKKYWVLDLFSFSPPLPFYRYTIIKEFSMKTTT